MYTVVTNSDKHDKRMNKLQNRKYHISGTVEFQNLNRKVAETNKIATPNTYPLYWLGSGPLIISGGVKQHFFVFCVYCMLHNMPAFVSY